jgi:hypothetical protein
MDSKKMIEFELPGLRRSYKGTAAQLRGILRAIDSAPEFRELSSDKKKLIKARIVIALTEAGESSDADSIGPLVIVLIKAGYNAKKFLKRLLP